MTIQQLLNKARHNGGGFSVQTVNRLSENEMIRLIVAGYDTFFVFVANPSKRLLETYDLAKALRNI